MIVSFVFATSTFAGEISGASKALSITGGILTGVGVSYYISASSYESTYDDPDYYDQEIIEDRADSMRGLGTLMVIVGVSLGIAGAAKGFQDQKQLASQQRFQPTIATNGKDFHAGLSVKF